MKVKWECSHYGKEGPCNIGLLVRLNQPGFLLVIGRWYLDVRVMRKG